MRSVFSGGGSVTGGCASLGGGGNELTFRFHLEGQEFDGNCSVGGGNSPISQPPSFGSTSCPDCGDPYGNLGRCACSGRRRACAHCGMVVTPGTAHVGCPESYLAISAEPPPVAGSGSPTPFIRFGELVGEAIDRLVREREQAAYQRGDAAGYARGLTAGLGGAQTP